MSDSLLIKDFRDSDVQRMRNLITGKHNNKTKYQVGYQKSVVDRKENDIWEEDDKIWTVKDGIIRRVTLLEDVKKKLRIPFSCPNCQGSIKTNLDRKMYVFHRTCFDCVVKMETKLKMEGKYDEYVKNRRNNNLLSFIEEAEEFIKEMKGKNHEKFITEEGDVENWEGSHNVKTDIWLKELEELKNQIK